MTLVATSFGLGAAVGGLALLHARWSTAAMVVAVIATSAIFARVLGWRVGLVVLLVVTCLIDRDTFPVGPLNIRPEQIAAIIALFPLATFVFRTRGGFSLTRPNRIELILLSWFAIALASSLIAAPNRLDSFKVLALLILSSLGMLLPRRLVAGRPELLEQIIRWTLLAFALESVYAWLVYVVHLFGPTISLSLNPGTRHLDAYGTLWEPNVLGAFAGGGAIAWMFLGPTHFRRPWIGTAMCLTACVASFARAAWIAVIIVVALSLATEVRRSIDLRAFAVSVLSATLLGAFILATDRIGNYSTGAAGVSNSIGSPTNILGRLYQLAPALSDLKQRPILGGGIDSFGQRHVLAGAPEHLTNLELLVVNDTGLLGLLVLIGFIVAIVAAAWRCRENATVLGLSATTLVIGITNQATETLELMITWLLIGLLLAAIDSADARRQRAPA